MNKRVIGCKGTGARRGVQEKWRWVCPCRPTSTKTPVFRSKTGVRLLKNTIFINAQCKMHDAQRAAFSRLDDAIFYYGLRQPIGTTQTPSFR